MNKHQFFALEKAIFQSVAYFDVFDYPLTVSELYSWLYLPKENRWDKKITKGDVFFVLEHGEFLKKNIRQTRGFLHLKNREDILKKRLERYTLAEKKYKKAIRISSLLRVFPYIKCIMVCNTLAYSNARKNSDIDLLFIVSHNHLWTARWWTVSLVKILGMRPTSYNAQDKMCFSVYVSDRNMNLKRAELDNDDIAFRFWLKRMIPIYDKGNYFQKFQEANAWLGDYFPHSLDYQTTDRRALRKRKTFTIVQESIEWIQDGFWEDLYQVVQKKILPKNLKKMLNKDTRVMEDKGLLKFHDTDRREEHREMWYKAMKNI